MWKSSKNNHGNNPHSNINIPGYKAKNEITTNTLPWYILALSETKKYKPLFEYVCSPNSSTKVNNWHFDTESQDVSHHTLHLLSQISQTVTCTPSTLCPILVLDQIFTFFGGEAFGLQQPLSMFAKISPMINISRNLVRGTALDYFI